MARKRYPPEQIIASNLRQRGLISRSGRGTVTIMDLNLGGSEELTFIFYNVPSFLSGAHICLVIRNLRMNNGAV